MRISGIKGATIALGAETLVFDGVEARTGPNYVTETALLRLFDKDGRLIDGLYPKSVFIQPNGKPQQKRLSAPACQGSLCGIGRWG